ncbi:helix-turn-helix transcriptional regulator [Sphingosinicella sp. BN140058]|uniref:helix-turn-helix domain-containing protein n=1 Tax=Sphingosinicella sp. BN140058 TaxID=1892855 RepID=UPI001013BD15|nr:helix-turn-helix transcriptional regulator [Sphingosinicella sp. BN140058]QAY79425.1 LuxR family transcriptional regulator [Sphingosinicella sp. BN140058]
MPAPDVSPRAIASLSSKELEILHLLATGHTGKSIAARLGQSETAINERLREARRKTGVTSSRELARIVDAQKIWDKNIDLSSSRRQTEESARPVDRGRSPSKGLIMMISAMVLAAAAAIGITLAGSSTEARQPNVQAAASDQLPLVGKWSLDVSRIPANERPQSVTLAFSVSADRLWTGESEIVARDGARQHAKATGAADGAPVPLTGSMTFADEVSMRQPAPNTLVLTFTKAGKPVSTRVYTIEDNRESMKETIVWAENVTPRMVTTYFSRVR